MKKKNILTMVLALALVAVLAVGATLAYFTDRDTEQNTFTMGHVDIDLTEYDKETGKWTDDGLKFENVVPGDKTDKEAKVTVSSTSQNCYVMVEVTVNPGKVFDGTSGFKTEDVELLYDAVKDAIDTDEWDIIVKQDADKNTSSLQCVFKAGKVDPANSYIVKADNELTLFKQIVIPPEFTNRIADQSFTLDLSAFAVQSANLDYNAAIWDHTFGELTNQEFEVYPVEPETEPAA